MLDTYKYPEINEYWIDADPEWVWASLINCLQTLYKPIPLNHQIEDSQGMNRRIVFIDGDWGIIGIVEFLVQPFDQTLLRFQEPGYPELDEVPFYETQIQKVVPPTNYITRLFEADGRQDKVREQYREYLYKNRLQKWSQARAWLMETLRIFGLRNPKQYHPALGPSQVGFYFAVLASPAQIAVYMRHLIPTMQTIQGNTIKLSIHEPVCHYAFENVIPDYIPLEIILKTKDASLNVKASPVLDRQSLLQVRLIDAEEPWKLWDILRDEMENAGYTQPIHRTSKPDKQNTTTQTQPPPGHPWEVVPDTGQNRLILKLWQEGCPVKEIVQQSRRTDKTINNLLALWRREFGEAVVPRRR